MLDNMTDKNLWKLAAPFIASRVANKLVPLVAFRFGSKANETLRARKQEAL